MLRVAGRVSTGAGGWAGDAGLSEARRSLPAVWFGNTVTLCEKPGVLPSTRLVVAPMMRS